MIFYFSGTGNSAYVARRLGQALGDSRLTDIARALTGGGSLRYDAAPGEAVGWVMPVHCWGVPPIMARFMRQCSITAEAGAYSYLVATCGDDTGLIAAQWRRLLPRPLQGHAAYSVQMPNTYILLPGFDTDPAALEQSKLQAAPARIAHIAARLRQRPDEDDTVSGSLPWLKSRVLYPLFVRFMLSDKGFHADPEACNGCGLCQRQCPAANITLDASAGEARQGAARQPRWHGHCAMCLRCLHACPRRAIQYGHQTQSKRRYRGMRN